MGIAIGIAAGVLGTIACALLHGWSAKDAPIRLTEEK